MQFGVFSVGDVTTDPTTDRTPSEHEPRSVQRELMVGHAARAAEAQTQST